MKKIWMIALALMLLVVSTASAEYDYEGKNLWYLDTDNIAWCNYTNMYDHMAAMGKADTPFNIDAYVNSEMGEGVINLLENVILYKETDQEVYDYWTELGIRKELFNADDMNTKFAVYTPLEALEEGNDKLYPVVFCLHGGGNPIFAAESYGYAQLGATEGFITVMPENCAIEEIQRIMEILRADYPIDDTRIYSTGLSAGGNRSYRNGTSDPALFAAIVPTGQPILFNGSATAEDVKALGGVAVYNIVGQYDAYNHYPFTIDGFQTSEQKIQSINTWFTANSIDAEPVTAESITDLLANADDIVKKNTGLDFPVTYTIEADGTEFWTGEYLNEDGAPVLRVSLVKDGLHWTTASYAELSWNFMKQFSRDPETRMLVYTPAND